MSQRDASWHAHRSQKTGNSPTEKEYSKGLEWTPPEEIADKDYPLVLSTGRERLSQYHTRTQTGRSGMDAIYKRETADISAADAREKKIEDGEMILVNQTRQSGCARPGYG